MQDNNDLNRREFAKLTLAALAGVSAGVPKAAFSDSRDVKKNPLLALSETHICRGLNTCRARGADRKNKCAGTGLCATARYHTCHGHNDCRGQGGCGDFPGENQCAGMGSCDVPLRPAIWQHARPRFEQLMKQAHWRCGPAPAATTTVNASTQ